MARGYFSEDRSLRLTVGHLPDVIHDVHDRALERSFND
jgi:hypothetical protein